MCLPTIDEVRHSHGITFRYCSTLMCYTVGLISVKKCAFLDYVVSSVLYFAYSNIPFAFSKEL